MRPILSQGKYDLNIKTQRQVLDPDDGSRVWCHEEHEIHEKVRNARLAVAVKAIAADGEVIVRDIHSSRTGDGWDLELFCKVAYPVEVYSSIKATVSRHLPARLRS
jgi:hypothetical protein